MKIAIPYDAETELIFDHFGHAERFKLYETDSDGIVGEELVSPAGSGHEAMAAFLAGQGVDTLICAGIGAGAVSALAMTGVKVYGGIRGYADAAVEALIRGILAYNPDPNCTHHEEGHDCSCHGGDGDEGCSCGSCGCAEDGPCSCGGEEDDPLAGENPEGMPGSHSW